MSYYWIFRHLRKTILCCLEAYRPTTDWRTESSSTSLRNLKTRTYLGCLSTEYKENIWTQEEEKTRGWKNDIMRSFIICPPPLEMITQQNEAVHYGQDVWHYRRLVKLKTLDVKNVDKRTFLYLRPGWRPNLKWIFKEQAGIFWSGFMWRYIGTNNGLWLNLGLHLGGEFPG